jgi:glycosyltransferase involved in cell wall biosynthesis
MKSMTSLPRVSVCLLTYKRAHLLPQTLDMLLAQDHRDFELIINDDRSPDGTEAIAREYARRDPRVRYFRNPKNLRYANNQNVAVLRARSEYVAIVHDSDLYRPHLLSAWTQALLDNPSAALVFSAAGRMNQSREVVGTYNHPYAPLIPGRALLDEMLSIPHSPIFGIVMLRRSCVLEAGPFDPRLPTLADVDMWLRLLAKHDAAYVCDPLYSIAPREADHPNHFTNWSIWEECELIFELNWRRRYQHDPEAGERKRRAIARMLYHQRSLLLATCARHLEVRGLYEGLRFAERQPPFGARLIPDRVATWEQFEALVEATLEPAEERLVSRGRARGRA